MFGQVRLMFTSTSAVPPTIPSKSFLIAGNSLPANIEILTIERWAKNTILLRIGHQFGIHEDANLSKPVTIDLETLVNFNGKTFTASEVSLSANQDIATLRRTQNWTVPTDGPTGRESHKWRENTLIGSTVT